MACGLILIPLSIGIITSIDEHFKEKEILSMRTMSNVTTRFNNSQLLLKTLHEYGLTPKQISSDCYSVKFADGDIIYKRSSENSPFSMTIKNIKDISLLQKELLEIEQVYNGNVQEYTYNRVLNNLPEGMMIESEKIMDDDSIVITLSVE